MNEITTDTKITTAFVDELEIALMVARKQGDEVIAFLVPYGPDHTGALKVGQGLVDRFRARGLTIKVGTARADNGLALLLEDVTPAKPAA
jgi:hypothetical protein